MIIKFQGGSGRGKEAKNRSAYRENSMGIQQRNVLMVSLYLVTCETVPSHLLQCAPIPTLVTVKRREIFFSSCCGLRWNAGYFYIQCTFKLSPTPLCEYHQFFVPYFSKHHGRFNPKYLQANVKCFCWIQLSPNILLKLFC